MKRTIYFITISVLLSMVLASCKEYHFYNNCHDIDGGGWDMNDTASFEFDIQDTVLLYDMTLTIRHTSSYSFQNLWMFLTLESPSGNIAKDTVECYLANAKGEFLGSGKSVIEMPLLICKDTKLNEAGVYKMSVVHGMRDTILKNITNICLTIDKK